jgi:hypothetical protein
LLSSSFEFAGDLSLLFQKKDLKNKNALIEALNFFRAHLCDGSVL